MILVEGVVVARGSNGRVGSPRRGARQPLFLIHEGWSHVDWHEGFEMGMNFAPDEWTVAIDERKHFFGPIVSSSEPDVREIVGEDWPGLVASLPRVVIGFRDHFRGETKTKLKL